MPPSGAVERTYVPDWLKGEVGVEFLWSRRNVVIEGALGPASRTLKAGTIMGIVTASGNWNEHDSGGADGTEVVAGVLFDDVVIVGTTDSDLEVVVVRGALMSGKAGVVGSSGFALYSPLGVPGTVSQAMLDALMVLGIEVREGL